MNPNPEKDVKKISRSKRDAVLLQIYVEWEEIPSDPDDGNGEMLFLSDDLP